MSASSDPIAIEVERSGMVESVHLADVAVVDAGGVLVAWAGEPERVAYLRSSAKPIQAAVCLEHGWEPEPEHVAVACASHNGEPVHLAAVRSVLHAAGIEEAALRCPPAWPLAPEAHGAVAGPAPVMHNCSGKHAAMLATCRINGWPLHEYRSVDHPLQRAVRARVETLVGRGSRKVGVDGCGVPTFALGLADAARTFVRFALSGAHARRALDAMRAHPFLVAGTNRMCTVLMEAVPGVVAKVGAEGLACAFLPEPGLGVAAKVRDGGIRAQGVALLASLRLLGVLGDPPPEALRPHLEPTVVGGDRRVGTVRWRGAFGRP